VNAVAAATTAPLPTSRYVVYFAIALAGCAADLATKQAVFAWRGLPGRNPPWWLVEGRLGIQTSVNPGALFGMGAGWWWLFAGFSVVALVGIFTWLFVYRAAFDRWLTVALAGVTAGILGNLYDRLGLWNSQGLPPELQHGVRDWILFVWPEIRLQIFNPWPNFNIADSLLVTGAIMLVVHASLWRQEAGLPNAAAPPAKAA
jgi:signal peptidase II